MYTSQQSWNFDSLKFDFSYETGLKWEENIELYIKYYHAKMTERMASSLEEATGELIKCLSLTGITIASM